MAKGSKAGELETLIARAAEIQAEVERLNSVDGALTGRAYVAAVASMPGADKKQADTISAAIDAGPPEGPTLASAERRFIMALRQFRPNGLLKSRHLSIYVDVAADASLARLGCSRESLYLHVARRLTERHPEIFGTQEKAGALQSQIDAANAELAELRARVEAMPLAVGADLMLLGDGGKDGTVKIGFAFTGGEVLFGPDRFAHLTAWQRKSRTAVAA